MQSPNLIVVAAAGSRKTTSIVEEALLHPNRRILILTYTIENVEQIKSYFFERLNIIPPNIKIMGWFTFLLHECVRPYQNVLYDKKRITSISFINGKSAKFINKANIEKFYFDSTGDLYTDKISLFVYECNELTKGLVINRLELIYDHIYIDEVQDMAGYDFEIMELLLKSIIKITFVGDNRQATYVTNHSPKNAAYKGKNIIELFKAWEKINLCTIEERTDCYRCNQSICDFADALYPHMPKTNSKQETKTSHEGLFIVRSYDVSAYIKHFKPQVLRYRKSIETMGLNALNFGLSKGKTFDRVLIFTTEPIRKYLKTGNLKHLKDIPKLYVGITRARYSVAFVYDDNIAFPQFKLFNPNDYINQDKFSEV